MNMKLILSILLLVTLGCKGQTPGTYNAYGKQHKGDTANSFFHIANQDLSPYFSYGRWQNGTPMFSVYDSGMRVVAYQRQDSALVVIDSAATIRVMVDCLLRSYQYANKQPEKPKTKYKWVGSE
jgi:hypothetical protein